MKSKCLVLVIFLFCQSTYGQSKVNHSVLDSIKFLAKETHSHNVIVWKSGEILYSLLPKDQEKEVAVYSITKTIHSLAIGKLITDGLIPSLDTPVSNYFPEWKQGNKRYLTIRHLLNNSSGIQNPSFDPDSELKDVKDILQLTLCAELSTLPGETFSYNNKAHLLVGGLISKIARQPSHLYIEDKLFKPMNIKTYSWQFDSVGQARDLRITADELLKIGILFLQEGQWENQQLVSKEYLKDAITPSQQYGTYGLAWWLTPGKISWIVDDAKIALISGHNFPKEYMKSIARLKGVYYKLEELHAKVVKMYGGKTDDFYEQLTKRGIYLWRVAGESGITHYAAKGWLGQYILLDPDKKTIVVRTIKQEDYHSENDQFPQLEELSKRLTF